MQNVHVQGHVDETLVLFDFFFSFFFGFGTWAYLANNSKQFFLLLLPWNNTIFK